MAALRLICTTLRRRFAKVPIMSSDQLMETMKMEKPDNHLVLLDVREEEEFKVSQLPGAIHISPNTKDMQGVMKHINEKVGSTEQPKTVVAYCAVGYRASLMIEQLTEHLEKLKQKDGAQRVNLFNLEGAIFKWANEGKDLVQPATGKKTTVVHPVGTIWGKILEANLRSYEPEDDSQK